MSIYIYSNTDTIGSEAMITNNSKVVVRSCKSGIGHEAELAAAVLKETKLLPHAALTVSAAERMIVELSAECEERDEE